MVVVAQLVRASDCGSEGRGFESHLPPGKKKAVPNMRDSPFFACYADGHRTLFLLIRFVKVFLVILPFCILIGVLTEKM